MKKDDGGGERLNLNWMRRARHPIEIRRAPSSKSRTFQRLFTQPANRAFDSRCNVTELSCSRILHMIA